MKSELTVKSVVALGTKLVGALCVFVLNIVVARRLGVEDVGALFLVLAFITPLSMISRLGFDTIVVRELAPQGMKSDQTDMSVVVCAVLVSGVVGLLFSFGVITYSDYIALELFDNLRVGGGLNILAFGIPVLSISAVIAAALQARKRIFSSLLTLSVVPAFVSLIIFFLDGARLDVNIAGGYLLFGYCSTLAFGIGRLMSIKRNIFEPLDLRKIRSWLAEAFTLVGAVIQQQFLVFAPTVLLGILASVEQVAIYSIAFKCSALFGLILIAGNSILSPNIAASQAEQNSQKIQGAVTQASSLMFAIALPLLCSTFLIPELFIGLFGPDFKGSRVVLQILVVGQFFNIFCGSVGTILLMTGEDKYFFRSAFLGLTVTLCCCFLFIPQFGAVGAALSASIGLSSINFMRYFFVAKRLGIRARPSLIPSYYLGLVR